MGNDDAPPATDGSGLVVLTGTPKVKGVGTIHGAFILQPLLNVESTDRSQDSASQFCITGAYKCNMTSLVEQLTSSGPLGKKWVLNLNNCFTTVIFGQNLGYIAADGRFYTYVFDTATNSYIAPNGFYTKITFETTRIVKREKRGAITKYDRTTGLMMEHIDQNGNQFRIERNPSNQAQVTKVIDDLDREWIFTYGPNSRISQITDYKGRPTSFGYDTSGNLTDITLPPTADFPTGKKTKFLYDANGNMLTTEDPRNQTYIRNFFDSGGKALSSDYGNGTMFFNYDPVRLISTVIDRNGNIVETKIDTEGKPLECSVFTNRDVNPLDPPLFTTKYFYDAQGEITKIILPRGNVHKITRDAKGNTVEYRRKLSDGPDNDSVDLIEKWEYEPAFNKVIKYIEERGNVPGANVDDFTEHSFYDHELVAGGRAATQTILTETLSFNNAFRQVDFNTKTLVFDSRAGTVATRYADANGDGFPDKGGLLIARREKKPKDVVTNQPQVIEYYYTYNTFGQHTSERDPLDHVSATEYFEGNFDLTNNPNRGYVKRAITDFGPTNLNLTTEYTYDLVGNMTSMKDPRGNITTYEYNDLNLMVKSTSTSPFLYEVIYKHDGNNNLIETHIQNKDANNQLATPNFFINRAEYNTLNYKIKDDIDATGSTPDRLVTKYEYDFNQNQTKVTEPEGNFHTVTYDERNLPFESIRGASDSSIKSSTKNTYDPNGNLIKVHDDDFENDAANTPMILEYDLFDRAVKVKDELLNETETIYDQASLAIEVISRGPTKGQPTNPGPTVILKHVFNTYDELRRLVKTKEKFLDVQNGITIFTDGNLDGLVENTNRYDEDSRLVEYRDDNHRDPDRNRKDLYTFDNAHRQITHEDALGNKQTNFYDKNSNVIRIQQDEKRKDMPSVTETFFTETFYDQLNRQTAIVNNIGNTVRQKYDSRSNVVETTDAQGVDSGQTAQSLDTTSEHGTIPITAIINNPGNKVISSYDGTNRNLAITRELTSDGVGGSTVTSTITTTQLWDADSRLKSQTDNNNNTTTYGYGHKNRKIETKYQDGTSIKYHYNKVDNITLTIDQNGTTTRHFYDATERLIRKEIFNLPVGDIEYQTTFEIFEYDGLSRLTKVEDNDSIVEYAYDSLDRVIRETQSIGLASRSSQFALLPSSITKTVSVVYDGVGNRLSITYPSGFLLTLTPDEIDRTELIKDGPNLIAQYKYIGPGARQTERISGNGVRRIRTYDANRRVLTHDHLKSDNSRITGFSYKWDRMDNRRFEERLTGQVTGSPGDTLGNADTYTYSSIYQLTKVHYGVPSSQLTINNNTVTPFTPSTFNRLQDYSLDGVHNRNSLTETGATPKTVTYFMNSTNPPGDRQVNQYTTVTTNSTPAQQTHDENGNNIFDGTNTHRFNYLNQLTEIIRPDGSRTVYRYDAAGRRISKKALNQYGYEVNFINSSISQILYFSDGADELEEFKTDNTLQKRYIYGIMVDEVLAADIGANRFFYHDNLLGSIVAITTSLEALQESYKFDVYGEETIFDSTNAQVVQSTIGNPFRFTGRRRDFEEASQFYNCRIRYYKHSDGRFIQRDPLGTWNDILGLGNGYTYAMNNPVNMSDRYGLQAESSKEQEYAKLWFQPGAIPFGWKGVFGSGGWDSETGYNQAYRWLREFAESIDKYRKNPEAGRLKKLQDMCANLRHFYSKATDPSFKPSNLRFRKAHRIYKEKLHTLFDYCRDIRDKCAPDKIKPDPGIVPPQLKDLLLSFVEQMSELSWEMRKSQWEQFRDWLEEAQPGAFHVLGLGNRGEEYARGIDPLEKYFNPEMLPLSHLEIYNLKLSFRAFAQGFRAGTGVRTTGPKIRIFRFLPFF